METSKSQLHKAVSARGFTMVEVLVAIAIMAVGLVALGSLAAQTMNGTQRSRFMGLAANLASEKLDDLNRWPVNAPYVYAASGTTVGSLTADTAPASVTSSSGLTAVVGYSDDIEITDSSTTTGGVCETVSYLNGTATNYKTTCHNADGTTTNSTSTTATQAGGISFHRRWTIEMDQPITGIRRITVLVTLSNAYLKPGVSFQMSMVRP